MQLTLIITIVFGYQVKAAYYRLSMQYHPDLNRSEDAHTLFQQILEAYEVLSNKRRRALYDQGIFVKSPHTSQGSTQRYPSVYKDMARNDQRFGKRQNAAELGQTDIYNFDEFYRQHYGASIHNRRNIRNTTEERTKEYNDLMMIQNVIRTALFLGLCWGIGLAAHSRFLK